MAKPKCPRCGGTKFEARESEVRGLPAVVRCMTAKGSVLFGGCGWRKRLSAASLIRLATGEDQRIKELEDWIKEEGERTDICTFRILKTICDGCQCDRKESRDAR